MYAMARTEIPVQPTRKTRRPALVKAGDLRDEARDLILAIAAKRDRAAFAALFEQFAPRIKAYVLALGAGEAFADDIAQDAMLAVWRSASTFDPARAGAEAWIFAIARNLRIDLLRRARFVVSGAEMPERPSPAPGADLVVEAAQAVERVRRALAALPSDQADVIRMSFLDERPHAEIERLLGIPLGTVKSRLRLAMAKLRSQLGDLK